MVQAPPVPRFWRCLHVDNAKYEQMLVNTLGPIELWALSTTPGDTALRNRLYDRVGFSRGVAASGEDISAGSALKEIERRKSERLRSGEIDARAQSGVVDELAEELVDGHGVGVEAAALRGRHQFERASIAAQ